MKSYPPGLWGRLFRNSKLLFFMLKDYAVGRYRKLPFRSLLVIIGTIFYILSPVDVIPDWMPLLGQLDDTALFIFCLFWIEKDLLDYSNWKMENL